MQAAAQRSDTLTRAAVRAPAAPAAPAPAPAPQPRVGTAEVGAHHGEIVQGLFRSGAGTLEHGLVTLPCGLFRTRASFRPLRGAPLTVHPGDRSRACIAARLTLDALGRAGWGGAVRIQSNVPLRWGCGSSTADVLATIRAVADAFGASLDAEWQARLAVAAEIASDSLMFDPRRAVLFAQRRGSVLLELGGPLPTVRVLGFNTGAGRGVETLSLPPMAYSAWEVEAFRVMLGVLRRAVERQEPALLGRVATASTTITQRHRPKRIIPQLLRLAAETGALGVQVAHSGTVAGLLFAPGPATDHGVERARAGLRRLGVRPCWHFTTDPDPDGDPTPTSGTE